MTEALLLAMPLGTGLLLGSIFFGGLWWTIHRGMTSPHPALWFLGSLVVRMSIVLAGFYVVSAGDWQRLLACLVGFIAARFAVAWATRRRKTCRITSQEELHAVEP